MIRYFHIKNFQAHHNKKITLSPNVTTVTGDNDCGKTALFRAIEWVCVNKPAGTHFISHGQEKTAVKIVIDNQSVIKRRSRKQPTTYQVNEKKLEAAGQSVPNIVEVALNIGRENLQAQHDPPFWFHLTGGQLAKQINKIVDLEIMDKTQSIIQEKARESKSKLKVLQEQESESKQTIESLQWLEEVKRKKSEVVKLIKQKGTQSQGIGILSDLISSIERRQSEIKSLPDFDLEKIDSVMEESGEQRTKILELEHLIEDIEEMEMSICQNKEDQKEVEGKLKTVTKCPTCGQLLP